MIVNEYGNKDDPLVILLGPMMVSGQDLYRLMRPHLKGEYHIIAPDQGGHGKAGAYISADEEYNSLKEFLCANYYTKIELVYGASLGVAIAYRLFLDEEVEVSHAWFDGVALVEHAGLAEWLMRRMFKKRRKRLAKNPVEASPGLVKMYGYEFARMMTQNFKHMTAADIDAICYACCHYDLQKLAPEKQKTLHLDFGEKDPDLKYSRKTIPLYMPEAELVIRKGYSHCGYMAAHTKEYVAEIERMLI